MKLFFDENFSPHIARGFAAFQEARKEEGVEVLHVVDVLGRGTPDERWIPSIAQMHGAVITLDFNIHRTRQLADLCRQHRVGIFFFRPPKKASYGYWQMIEWILKAWALLKERAKTTQVPFEYEVTPRRTAPRRL
jgi:hypothetical protein